MASPPSKALVSGFDGAALGVFVALMLYVMVGAFWVITIDVSLGGAPLTHIFNPAAPAFALMWPLQIAQIVGLVGVSIG